MTRKIEDNKWWVACPLYLIKKDEKKLIAQPAGRARGAYENLIMHVLMFRIEMLVDRLLSCLL